MVNNFKKLQKSKPRYAEIRFLKMAIFHLNEKNISRSDGRSVVACAAYRACEKLEDKTYGNIQDYTKKNGLEYKNIYAPEHTNTKFLDRQTLWNEVEKKEFNGNGSMKANARLAKEYTCALPHEISAEQRAEIVDSFCRDFVKKHNVIVDACIHTPHKHEHDDEADNKNYHVHIMFTTRLVNEKGELGKKQRTFNDDGPQILKDSRATFAHVVNTALENAGLDERVDHRSYKDQGLDFLEPTVHEGHEVTALRRDGIDTEISLKNDVIKAKNLDAAREYQQIISGLNQEIIVPSAFAEKIEALESELRLTEAEERALLAEFANIEQEEKYIQEQTAQIDNAYVDFIELQNKYIEFANTAFDLLASKDSEFKAIEKQLKKTEKLANKFQVNVHSLTLSTDLRKAGLSEPPHDLLHPHVAASLRKEAGLRCNKKIQELAEEKRLLNTVVNLEKVYALLSENNIELPIPRQKNVFGLSFGNIPPSAETLAADMDQTWTPRLGLDFKYELENARKSDVQKAKERREHEEQLLEAQEQRRKDWEAEQPRREREAELAKQYRAEQQLLAKQEKQAEQELQEKWRKESDAAAVLEREKLEAVKKEQENKPKNAIKDKIIRNDLGM
jgi:hypothetical protein